MTAGADPQDTVTRYGGPLDLVDHYLIVPGVVPPYLVDVYGPESPHLYLRIRASGLPVNRLGHRPDEWVYVHECRLPPTAARMSNRDRQGTRPEHPSDAGARIYDAP